MVDLDAFIGSFHIFDRLKCISTFRIPVVHVLQAASDILLSYRARDLDVEASAVISLC